VTSGNHLGEPVTIEGVRFEAIPVRHSIRAAAVGSRVSAGNCCLFYLPDVADLPSVARALRGADVYIGDGATVNRSMVREKNGSLIGHAPITRQLVWCKKARVRFAIFTHCGSPIVRGDPRQLKQSYAGSALNKELRRASPMMGSRCRSIGTLGAQLCSIRTGRSTERESTGVPVRPKGYIRCASLVSTAAMSSLSFRRRFLSRSRTSSVVGSSSDSMR
jgi:Beta-lactamase superfamily domain